MYYHTHIWFVNTHPKSICADNDFGFTIYPIFLFFLSGILVKARMVKITVDLVTQQQVAYFLCPSSCSAINNSTAIGFEYPGNYFIYFIVTFFNGIG